MISRFKIPTLLGLSVIMVGLFAGVYMAIQNQPTSFFTQASPDQVPKNITITNIESESVSISWQTTSKVPGFISFGKDSTENQVLDDRDSNTPTPRTIHHVTLKKLSPQTKYKFKIFSGKQQTEVKEVTSAPTDNKQNSLKPIIGSVISGEQPLNEGIVYLSSQGGVTQSATINNLGSFIIPLSNMRKSDLSTIFPSDLETIAKLTVTSEKGQATALVKLGNTNPVTLKVGQNLDLTTPPLPTPSPITSDLSKFDLHPTPGDGFITTADNAVVLNNFGRNPKDKRADLNGDGIVDRKDLDLMSEKIKELGGKSINQ